MRTYWIKIFAGAFGIFAVGMLIITGIRGAKSKLNSTFNSSDPIPIPLIGLVPFRVDSSKLGSLRKVEFLRQDPEHVSGVRVFVALGDSVRIERLRNCVLAIDNLDNIGEKTTFRCQPPGAEMGSLEPFGMVVVKGYPDSFPLLLPGKAVADLRRTTIRFDHNGLNIDTPGDPVAEAFEARSDSIQEALDSRIDARSDSIDELKELTQTLEDSAADLSAPQRRALQHSADSVRAVMRQMVDRMKADEARLQVFHEMGGLTPAQLDSLSHLGARLSDSVRASVAKQLQEVQVEVRRAHAEAASVTTVEAPAVPSPPSPPKAARPR